MPASDEIFLIGESGIKVLPSRPFRAGLFGKNLEEALQTLIAKQPNIINGRQIEPGSADPPRFVLLRREMPVGDWSLDHLLVDQRGVPTFVEAKLIENPEARRAVIGQVLDYVALASEKWGEGQLRQLSAKKAAGFFPGAIFAGIDAGLSLVSLFKTDTEIKGVAITGNNLALQALVAKQLAIKCNTTKIIHPTYFYPPLGGPSDELLATLASFSETQTKANLFSLKVGEQVQTPLKNAVDDLSKAISQYKDAMAHQKDLQTRYAKATSKKEKDALASELGKATKDLSELTKKIQSFDPAHTAPPATGYDEETLRAILAPYTSNKLRVDLRMEALKSLQARMMEFIAALSKPDSNGITPLQAMLRAQAMKKAKGDSALPLVVQFVAAGGNNIAKRNIFYTSLRFSGGVIAQFLLMNPDGTVAKSGVVSCYGGQLGEDDIPAKLNKNNTCSETIPP